jgi:hypothetical protein
MIYTSYFGNWRNFPPELIKVAISNSVPPGFTISENCIQNTFLAPSKEIIRDYKLRKINEFIYTYRYYLLMDDIKGIIKKCLIEYNDNNHLFLCFEKRGRFCHRHLLQDYVDRRYPELGIKFKEL